MSTPDEVISDVTLQAIRAEAIRAHILHGAKGTSMLSCELPDTNRLAILMEEVGEVAHEINELEIHGLDYTFIYAERMEKELIQVAAMAATWIEVINGKAR